MDTRKKKTLFLAGGIALLAVVAVLLLVITLGGSGAKQNEKHYETAESAFLRRDYDTALSELEKAIEAKPTEDAYLLLANVHYARGDREEAIEALYLGYSRVGGDAIEQMLEALKAEEQGGDAEQNDDGVTVGGRIFAPDTFAVVLSGKGLTNADFATLCTLSGLESLSVSDNAISDLSPITALKDLTSLQISNNSVSDLTPLSGLTKLKTLYLDGNPARDLTPLYSLSGLRTLSMKNTDASAKEVAALKQALPNCSVFSDTEAEEVVELSLGGRTFNSDVTELNLGGLEITDISVLSSCRNLVKLDLRDNKITDISPLVELQQLEWLCLWNNGVEDISPLMSLSALRYLDMDTNAIRDITALGYLTGLEELWLNNNTNIRSFTALKQLTGLTKLGLKNTGIGDGQLELLNGLQALEEMTLEENTITAEKFEALEKALPNCSIAHSELLWSVTLGGRTYTSDAEEIVARSRGIKSLSGLEHFTNLTRLDLDDNEITDLSPLYGLTNLRTLSLRGNGLSAEAIEALQTKLPACRILSDPEPEETEAPEADPAAVGMGTGAALSMAGTGSGYAVLWMENDPVSIGVKNGFITRAAELQMNVVLDVSFPAGTADFSSYLSGFRFLGADVVLLAVDDDVLAQVLAQAEELEYAPQFVQVY